MVFFEDVNSLFLRWIETTNYVSTNTWERCFGFTFHMGIRKWEDFENLKFVLDIL